MNIKDIRRENMRKLAETIGGVSAMAERISKSQSQISHVIGSNPVKNIGHKLAGEVESSFNKPHGWLDTQHFGIEEDSAIYFAGEHPPTVVWVPVLNWEDIQIAPTVLHQTSSKRDFIPTNIKIGKYAYGLRVRSDSMEAPNGVSFIENSVILIGPEKEYNRGDFVIASHSETSSPILRQYVRDNGQAYLKPLNSRYPIAEFSSSGKIYGKVCQMVMTFD